MRASPGGMLAQPELAGAGSGDRGPWVWLFRGEAVLAGGFSGSCRRVSASRRVDRTIRRQPSFMRQRSSRNPETLHGKDENPARNPAASADHPPARTPARHQHGTPKAKINSSQAALDHGRGRDHGPSRMPWRLPGGSPLPRSGGLRGAARRAGGGVSSVALPVAVAGGPGEQRGPPCCRRHNIREGRVAVAAGREHQRDPP